MFRYISNELTQSLYTVFLKYYMNMSDSSDDICFDHVTSGQVSVLCYDSAALHVTGVFNEALKGCHLYTPLVANTMNTFNYNLRDLDLFY